MSAASRHGLGGRGRLPIAAAAADRRSGGGGDLAKTYTVAWSVTTITIPSTDQPGGMDRPTKVGAINARGGVSVYDGTSRAVTTNAGRASRSGAQRKLRYLRPTPGVNSSRDRGDDMLPVRAGIRRPGFRSPTGSPWTHAGKQFTTGCLQGSTQLCDRQADVDHTVRHLTERTCVAAGPGLCSAIDNRAQQHFCSRAKTQPCAVRARQSAAVRSDRVTSRTWPGSRDGSATPREHDGAARDHLGAGDPQLDHTEQPRRRDTTSDLRRNGSTFRTTLRRAAAIRRARLCSCRRRPRRIPFPVLLTYVLAWILFPTPS